MTETSRESTQPLTDTINVLPILSEAKAPVSLTLTIDKSVSKVAAWAMLVIIGLGILCGVCVAVTVGTVWHSKEYETDTNAKVRVLQNHVDELTSKVRDFERTEDRYHAAK